MSAPAFILEAETVYNTATTPKVTAAFNILQGDVIVAYVMTDSDSTTGTIANSGTALAWTLVQSVTVVGTSWVGVWTHVVSQSRAAVTVSFGAVGGGFFGGNVLLFRGSDGIGASSKTNGSGAPTLNLTTTRANSAIVVPNVDFAVGSGARTWRANAGALTEVTYSVATNMTVYGGYHADAGPVGTYAVGLSLPVGQTYSIIAVEVFGQTPQAKHRFLPLRMRG